ncbi:MAG: Hsp20/alpha crystallin family protein [Spirochaetaceae bacterium]
MADKNQKQENREVDTRKNEPRRCINPLSQIKEEDGKVLLTVEMPGVSKENLDIQLNNDELHISATRDDSIEAQGYYLLRERPCADYRKVFTIDDTIDREKVDATMDNGILYLTLYIKESVKPRKIEVKTG